MIFSAFLGFGFFFLGEFKEKAHLGEIFPFKGMKFLFWVFLGQVSAPSWNLRNGD